MQSAHDGRGALLGTSSFSGAERAILWVFCWISLPRHDKLPLCRTGFSLPLPYPPPDIAGLTFNGPTLTGFTAARAVWRESCWREAALEMIDEPSISVSGFLLSSCASMLMRLRLEIRSIEGKHSEVKGISIMYIPVMNLRFDCEKRTIKAKVEQGYDYNLCNKRQINR